MTSFPIAALILLLAATLGIVSGLFPHPWLYWAATIGLVAAGVAVWPNARQQSRRLVLIFIFIAAGATFWTPAATIVEAAAKVSEIASMLVAAQVLNDGLIYGGYDQLVRKILSRLRWRPSWTALLGGYVLTWGFSLTSMPVVYSSLYGESGKDGAAGGRASPGQAKIAVLLARAFAAAAIAAPIQPTVLLAVAISGASLVQFLLVTIPLTLVLLLVALVDQRRQEESPAKGQAGSVPSNLNNTNTLLLLGLFLSLGIATVAISFLPVGVVAGMAGVVGVSAFIWGWIGRRVIMVGARPEPDFFREKAAVYATRMADGVLLLAAGGVAGYTLAQTPLMDAAAQVLQLVTVPAVAAILTIIVVIGLRLLGVAPAVIIITIGPVLRDTLPLSGIALAALLSAGSGFAFVTSPFSITSAMTSTLTGWSPVEVSFPRQKTFAIAGSLVTALYVTIFG